jgi:capsular polysaccharide transport system permease protein
VNKNQKVQNPKQARNAAVRRERAQAAKAKQESLRPTIAVAPPASGSQPRKRHWVVVVSFFVVFVLPFCAIWWYLSERAVDQYVSKVGFSVRTEETTSAMDIFGSLASLSKGSSSDTDILYEFIQSQELVQHLDEELNLKARYSKPKNDPYFGFEKDGSIEDLVDYWSRMVKIYYDGATGLIELNVLAFAPDDAQEIAEAIFRKSSTKINDLSAIARNDATRYARVDMDLAIERLKAARRAVTDFRNKHQIVDPQADIQGQVGLLNTLQVQLADALIELDLLEATTRATDPRIEQITLKIQVIRARIKAERNKFGRNETSGGEAFSTIVGDFEELEVDREFAEQAYLSALSAFNTAKAEAQRQSRYLAAYISPTKAETSTYPERDNILILAAIFLFLLWAILVLLAYAVKDRR